MYNFKVRSHQKFPVEMGIEEISDGNRCERLNFRWNSTC